MVGQGMVTGTLLGISLVVAMPRAVAEEEPEVVAVRLVDALAAGEYEKATADFDATVKAKLTSEALESIWNTYLTKNGTFKERGTAWSQRHGLLTIVFVPITFEKAKLDVQVTVTEAEEVTGLFFRLHRPREVKPPPYFKPGSIDEKEVTVGSGDWELPGTLSIPKEGRPVPAVVLVHGSGPSDRDETIGGNKPFRDIAWGLASNGIAVLRYEKRTQQYASRLISGEHRLTVREESIDDAVAAAGLLRKTEGIDPKRVFVIGHSLGGMLVPRIAEADPGIAGFVIMAGATRSLEEMVLEQMSYISNLDGRVTEKEKQQLAQLEAGFERIRSLDPDKPEGKPEDLLGAPPEYWLDLRDYDPAERAKKIGRPMMILQGERDYQVTMKDFERWKAALSDRENVRFETYPSLNHLFIPGEGKSKPAEYEKSGHVAEEVIRDIAAWINSVTVSTVPELP